MRRHFHSDHDELDELDDDRNALHSACLAVYCAYSGYSGYSDVHWLDSIDCVAETPAIAFADIAAADSTNVAAERADAERLWLSVAE